MNRERSQRSLWQVLGVYVAGSWVCLQVVDVLIQNVALPSWVFTMTLTLLAIGLPITAATAYLQGIGRREKSEAAATTGLFTWKNLRNGAIAALAVWGIAVTGWVIQTDRGNAVSERNLVTSLDEIRRLAGEYRFSDAYAIAEALDGQITDESVREAMWSEVARELTIETDPPGATVYRRDYVSDEADWREKCSTW